jgi:hypothetical protein
VHVPVLGEGFIVRPQLLDAASKIHINHVPVCQARCISMGASRVQQPC